MKWRVERDSMGEVRVPEDVLYGAQTQRAVENFAVAGQRFQPALHSGARPDQIMRRPSECRTWRC